MQLFDLKKLAQAYLDIVDPREPKIGHVDRDSALYTAKRIVEGRSPLMLVGASHIDGLFEPHE